MLYLSIYFIYVHTTGMYTIQFKTPAQNTMYTFVLLLYVQLPQSSRVLTNQHPKENRQRRRKIQISASEIPLKYDTFPSVCPPPRSSQGKGVFLFGRVRRRPTHKTAI